MSGRTLAGFLTMTITSSPWFHPDPEQSPLRLDIVPEKIVHALAAGAPASVVGAYGSPYIVGPECAGLWRMRSNQLHEVPADAPWITRFIVDPQLAFPVGVAGFHGAPDEAGMVEVGYRVEPAFRRRGYARRSLETLLNVARQHPDVLTVRATVSPDTRASRSLIEGYGFSETGEQWDEEDGREIIYYVSARPAPNDLRSIRNPS